MEKRASVDNAIEDSELASRVRGTIRSLLHVHATSVSLLWGGTKNLLLANAQYLVQPREDKNFLYLTVRKNNMSVAELRVGITGKSVGFGTYPKPSIPWGKAGLEKLLKDLPSYRVMNGINLPYGYVRDGQVVAIMVRRESDYLGYECDRFVLKGAELARSFRFARAKSFQDGSRPAEFRQFGFLI